MLSIELDITYTNKPTIYFGNKTLLNFITIVQINILVNITNFYIMDTSILFIFYLKNINILSIYLNNITNQLICQNNKSISII